MPTVSKFEDIAQDFLSEHPPSSVVTASKLQTWVADHVDGFLLKADLAIEDPGKRLAALRRHLNDGGKSGNMAEDRRFVLEIQDAANKTYVVRLHADAVHEKATDAISKSVMNALSPLKAGRRAVDSVKLDELPDIERKVLEIARDNITAMEKAVKPTLAQEVDRIWIADMARRGIPADQAKILRDALPQISKLQKLLRATA